MAQRLDQRSLAGPNRKNASSAGLEQPVEGEEVELAAQRAVGVGGIDRGESCGKRLSCWGVLAASMGGAGWPMRTVCAGGVPPSGEVLGLPHEGLPRSGRRGRVARFCPDRADRRQYGPLALRPCRTAGILFTPLGDA